MPWKSLSAFVLVALLATGAALYRFGDSAHAIGLLNQRGGKARHPFHLTSGQDLYTLIATASVLPPVRGDIRVELRGRPAMDYVLYDSLPIIDLGLHRRPKLQGGVLHGVIPRDRLALWIVMRPAANKEPGWLGSPTPLKRSSGRSDTPLALIFSELHSDLELLRIPVTFSDPRGGRHDD